MAKVQAGARSVEVLCGGGDKGVGVLGIDFLGGLANYIAVEEGHWLAKGNGADDEGDEEHGVDASHDKKAKVSVRPVVADADHDVKSGNACLTLVRYCKHIFAGFDSPH